MSNLRVASIGHPFDEPGMASRAAAALSRADAMGLLHKPVTCLDFSALEQLRVGMAEAGIGQVFIAELDELRSCEPARLSALVTRIIEALEQSPAPTHEWPALLQILGLDLLVRLLGISPSSARRYLSGERATPDSVAARGGGRSECCARNGLRCLSVDGARRDISRPAADAGDRSARLVE